MKLSFVKIIERLTTHVTGFSTPIVGLSWNPPRLESETARRLIIFLEDKRVLYMPYTSTKENFMVESVLQIREKLTEELINVVRPGKTLDRSIRTMRANCREFLTDAEKVSEGEKFNRTIVIFQWIMRYEIANIAMEYGVDIEGPLAVEIDDWLNRSSLPPKEELDRMLTEDLQADSVESEAIRKYLLRSKAADRIFRGRPQE